MKNSDDNVIIITLDSCRWDSFVMAKCTNINSAFNMRAAYSHGTYTMPSHMSIYAGILPTTNELVPYYNRFEKQLFRLNNRDNKEANALINFPPGTKNIVRGFKNKHYTTLCLGAVGWFRSPTLTEDFDRFIFTGIDLSAQLAHVLNFIESEMEPFFILLNIGETHDPYEYGGKIAERNISRARMRQEYNKKGYIREEHLKQVEAMSYIDSQLLALFDLLNTLSRNTTVVICADHGECFGEDNLYGHGFYHEKIMEVPLGITFFKGKHKNQKRTG